MFDKQVRYRTLNIKVNDNVKHNDFMSATYKETHEGTMQSFDNAPFEPATFPFEVVLDWLQRGGGEMHGYDWEVTEA